MSRTIAGALATSLASGQTTLARCLRLDLRDDTSLGITDHDIDITVDLGDGALTYSSTTGVLPSAVSLSIGLDADSFEATGPITDVITRAQLLGGRYDRARARLFDVDWSAPTRFLRLMSGRVTTSKLEAGRFTLEIRSAADAFNQSIGRLISPYCRHDFGVGQCQASPPIYPATVTDVDDEISFTVDFPGGAPPADAVRDGLVSFLTGDLVGNLPVEVFDLSVDGLVSLFSPLSLVPTVGDSLQLRAGCDKTRIACKAYGQILNFGGFPDLRGTDEYLKYPNPSE